MQTHRIFVVHSWADSTRQHYTQRHQKETPEAFQAKLAGHQTRLQSLFQESKTLEAEIETHLGQLQLEPEMENR
jgi:hypothetical protein